MNLIQCLKTRRSIRSYKPDSIPEATLNQILEAANYAPSSKNTQPWEYYVLTGQEKDHICKIVQEEYPKRGKPFRKREEYTPTVPSAISGRRYGDFRTAKNMTNVASAAFVKQAPVLILVFNKAPFTAGEENVIKEASKESLLAFSVEVQSVAAFIYSILLAAHDLGLGGCWIADFNFCRDKVKEYLETENDLVAAVVLGYPKSSVPSKKIEAKEVRFWKEK